MSNLKNSKGKHLTMEDRIIIQYCLEQNYLLKEIAERIGKDATTISKEIKRNKFIKISKKKQHDLLTCKFQKGCTERNVCNKKCTKLCKKCVFLNCYRKCTKYTTKVCDKLNRYPYVCNGCVNSTTCSDDKVFYKAKVANEKYIDILKSSREGLKLLFTLDQTMFI